MNNNNYIKIRSSNNNNNGDFDDIGSNHSSFTQNIDSPCLGRKSTSSESSILATSGMSPENLVIHALAGSPSTAIPLTFSTLPSAPSLSSSDLNTLKFDALSINSSNSNTYEQLNSTVHTGSTISDISADTNAPLIFRPPINIPKSVLIPELKSKSIPIDNKREVLSNTLQLSNGVFGSNSNLLFPVIGNDNPPPILSTSTSQLWSEVLQRGNMSTLPSNFFLTDTANSNTTCPTSIITPHNTDLKRPNYFSSSNSMVGDSAKNNTSGQTQDSAIGIIYPPGKIIDDTFSNSKSIFNLYTNKKLIDCHYLKMEILFTNFHLP